MMRGKTAQTAQEARNGIETGARCANDGTWLSVARKGLEWNREEMA